jgi:membrane associated rhomboid family serine protease
MLEDRPYMRQPTFGSRRSLTVTLLIVNVAAFVLQSIMFGYPPRLGSNNLFALSVDGLRHGYVWQLLTYQFMHGGIIHLLLNCWVIYFFGREMEETLGRAKFAVIYFGSGVAGGAFQALAGWLYPHYFGGPVVGASAAAFGLVASFALLFPERPLTMLLFFIIPVNMRAKFLLIITVLLTTFGIAFPHDNLAHAAHMGGMLFGMFYIRHAMHWDWSWLKIRRGQRPRRLIRVVAKKAGSWGPEQDVEPEAGVSDEEFYSREVDPILDKISERGIQSLTAEERRILETARQRMGRK